MAREIGQSAVYSRTAFALLSSALSLACNCAVATTATYLPTTPDTVVARLPAIALETDRQIASYSASTANEPRGIAQRVMTLLVAAQQRGDERYLGNALGLIAPWLEQNEMPAELLLSAAKTLQASHRFDDALTLLDRLLAHDPNNAQAHLERAVIRQAAGEPLATLDDCQRLRPLTPPLLSTTCIAAALRYTARAEAAFKAMQNALQGATVTDRSTLGWSLRVTAELAEITGRETLARHYLEAATQREPDDIRNRLALADLLLRQGRDSDVLTLLDNDRSAPLPLLRRALAARRSNAPEAPVLAAQWREFVTQSRLRGDTLHLREQAYAALELFDQPQQALELALANWQLQREYSDARLVIDAAAASGNDAAAAATLNWLDSLGNQDRRLRAARQRLTRTAGGRHG